MAVYTMGQAAKRLNLSKPTISKYLKAGRISGRQIQQGKTVSYEIDGAELARFEAEYNKPSQGQRPVKQESIEDPVAVAVMQKEIEMLRERVADLERRSEQARQDHIDAQERAHQQFMNQSRLIEDKRPSERKGFLGLFR